ncbi:hypothetical protein PRIPAC_80583 [Pristionchus pacificus]|nr:hypothetical protein PRIPAC_80583 [Pristionchus pacificus]
MDNDFGESFNGIFLAINGPLLTLAFNNVRYPHSEIVLSATTPFSFDQIMSSNPPTFISSPGFMCGNAAHQVHRSSAFNTGNAYTLRTQNDKEMMFNFDIVMDTDSAHPVSIYDQKGAQNHPFSGNFRDRTNEGIFKMQTYRATVSFTPGTADGFYGMRVWADDVGGEGTKTTTSGKDTTTSSTGNPSILILLLAIVAAMFV